MHPEDRELKNTRKVCWVPADPSLHTVVNFIEYDQLITKPTIEEEDNLDDFLNHRSKIVTKFIAEKEIATLKENEFIQIERRGYCRVDKDEMNNGFVDLIFIPTGKQTTMSDLENEVSAASVAGSVQQPKKEEALKTEEENKPLSKKQEAKLKKKAEKKEKAKANKDGQE